AIDAIVAVSEVVAARFRHRLSDPRKLHVLHNGSAFPISLHEVGLRQHTDDLIFLGGENPTKGAHDMLALWRLLVEMGFEGRLHWYGAIGNAFQSRIAALPNANAIEVHGQALRSAIFKTAGRAKVMLMLSRVEPFGMATVECMGMGCVPVGWDIDT